MSESEELARTIKKAIDQKVTKASRNTRTKTTGKVVKVNPDGTAVVDAGSGNTPVIKSAVSVKVGDEVSITVKDGKATIDENYTDPAASSEKVVKVEARAIDAQAEAMRARTAAETAEQDAERAHDAADAAQESADDAAIAAGNAETAAGEALNAAKSATFALSDVENVVGTLNWIAEHGTWTAATETAPVADRIYYTRTGSGTSQDPYKYTVVPEVEQTDNPASLGWYYLVVDESVQAYLASHLWLDNYGLNLSVDSANGYRIHQGTVDGTKPMGTYIFDPQGKQALALTADGEIIGKPYVLSGGNNESHMELDYHSLKMFDKEGNTYLHVSDMRDKTGYATVYDEIDGIRATRYLLSLIPEDITSVTIDGVELTSGYRKVGHYIEFDSQTSPGCKIVVTYTTRDSETKAFTFGTRAAGGIGAASYSEGIDNISSGMYSHCEGHQNTASGNRAHCEGWLSQALGAMSHSEGCGCIASGATSHAEGDFTTARGSCSHAQNSGTIAAGTNQTAIGRYNVETVANSDYAFIIGNGTADNARSNALAVTWDGDECFKSTAARPTRQDSAPSTNTILHTIDNVDSNGSTIGYSGIVKNTSNNMYRSFAVRNEKNDGTEVTTALYLYANRDGTHSASMTSGTVWPIANGGTNATSAADARTNLGLKTLATKSSATVTNSRGAVSGSATNSSAISAGNNYTYEFNVTIPSGYMYTGIGRIGRSGTGNGNLDIAGFNTNTSGQTVTCTIAMHNHGTSAVSKNAVTCTVECCYIKTNPSISFS